MGYCYITGKKINGRWVFEECDGRKTIETAPCGGGDPGITYITHPRKIDHARRHHCIQYCKTYKDAVDALEDWYENHPEEEK